MEEEENNINIKLTVLEKKINNIERLLNNKNDDYIININDRENVDKPLIKEDKRDLENDDKVQRIYCHCCNFTNSNHNAVKLILQFFIIFFNIITVSALCYMLCVR